MSKLSLCIVAYGLSLLMCDGVSIFGLDAQLQAATVVPCWSVGLIVIAAGLAAAQGRRSLRLTGLYLAIVLPLILAAAFTWNALAASQAGSYGGAAVSTFLAIASVGVLGAINMFMPREGIATRGYAVRIAPAVPSKTTDAAAPARRSEAG